MRLILPCLIGALALAAAACGDPDPRPLTPRALRLGVHEPPDRPPLERDEVPARELLVPGPVVRSTPTRLHARAVLDGQLEGAQVRWSATGAQLVEAAGDEATFARRGGPWTVEAVLVRSGRVLDRGVATGGGAPHIVAGADRAVVAQPPGGMQLEVHGGRSLEGLRPGETVSVRWSGPEATSPWSTATAGGLPATPPGGCRWSPAPAGIAGSPGASAPVACSGPIPATASGTVYLGVIADSADEHVIVVLKNSGRLIRYNLRTYAQVVLDTYPQPHAIGRVPPGDEGSELLYVIHDQDLGLVSFLPPGADAVPSGGFPAVAGMALSGLMDGR